MQFRQTILLFILMLGFSIFPASLLSGGKLADLFTLGDCSFFILVGNLLLGVYAATLGYIGTKQNATTHQLIENTFGRRLGRCISLLLALTQIGWFGVGIAFFAETVEAIFSVSHVAVVAVSTLLMVSSAWYGLRAMIALSLVAVPALIAMMGVSISQSLGILSIIDASSAYEFSPTTLMTGLLIVVGSFISGATFTPDYIHKIKDPRNGFKVAFFAFLIGNSLTFFAGMLGAKATGHADIIQVLLQQGFSMVGIGLLALSVWTTNDNSLYTCSLAVSQFTPFKRRAAVIFAGILGACCSNWLYLHMIGWLSMLSLVIPPIGIILIIHHFMRKETRSWAI